MYCRSGLKRKLLAPGGLQYQDVGWAQCSFLWASFVTPLGPAYTAVFRTKCLCKAGRWHFPEPHTLGADEFTIYTDLHLPTCQNFCLFSGDCLFRVGALSEKRALLIFCVVCWCPSIASLLFLITIHQAETVRSDTEILARPKLLCKSNVSSNARCFVKRLHS